MGADSGAVAGPGRARRGTARDNRLFVEAVLYRYRAGIPWRDLPSRFGDFRVIHTRHMRWSKSGVWEKVFRHLAADADNEYAMIDATIIRVHQHGAGAKGGTQQPKASAAPEGGLSTKIHATCDALGNPTGFHLTPGHASDLAGVEALLPQLLKHIHALLADKAYDAQERVMTPWRRRL